MQVARLTESTSKSGYGSQMQHFMQFGKQFWTSWRNLLFPPSGYSLWLLSTKLHRDKLHKTLNLVPTAMKTSDLRIPSNLVEVSNSWIQSRGADRTLTCSDKGKGEQRAITVPFFFTCAGTCHATTAKHASQNINCVFCISFFWY